MATYNPRIMVLSDEALTPVLQRHLSKYSPAFLRPRTLDEALEKTSLMDLAIITFHYTEGGIQACRKLLAEDPGLPIIILSKSPRYFDIQAVFKAGAHDCLLLPLESDMILESVESALEKRLKDREAQGQIGVLRKEIEALQEEIHRLEDGVIDLVFGLLQKKHAPLEAHSRHVMRMAELFAGFLGWEPEKIKEIRLAGAFHDIGYLVIPDEYARRRPETPPEIYAWKRHPVLSKLFLASISTGDFASTAVAGHHEAFDGTGFPDGLPGNRTPLEARFLALVNGFSTLVRPHWGGERMPIEDAMLAVMDGAGKAYDPELVEQFVRFISEVDVSNI